LRAMDLPINPRPMYPTLSMADSLNVGRDVIPPKRFEDYNLEGKESANLH
jgi:hypothetical protein